MNDYILNIIADDIHERMRDIIMQDEDFLKSEKEVIRYEKKYNTITSELSQEQCKIINLLLDSYNANNSAYAKATYKQGFKDCYTLLCEIGAIRRNSPDINALTPNEKLNL
ncbi:MAG: hypothetical protein K2N46_14135 [Lachnospiraceae bacterium]|nr:hypothetical protein [Lachnospiraceae bacterium]